MIGQDGIGNQTTITIVFSPPESAPDLGYGEIFTATGTMIQERNWLDVYRKWEKWSGNKVLIISEDGFTNAGCSTSYWRSICTHKASNNKWF